MRILLTGDGGYLVAGTTSCPAGFDVSQDPFGETDYWIVKTDASGNKLWDRRFGGSQFDGLTDVVQTADGGFLLGGTSLSNLSSVKSEPNKGAQDYWIIKVDEDGNKEWDRTIGGSAGDALRSLIVTKEGGYLLCGFSSSGISGDKTQPSQGGRDFWMVKVGTTGMVQDDVSFGGSLEDYLEDAVAINDQEVLLSGSSASPVSGDKESPPVNNSSDYWVVKVAMDEFLLRGHHLGIAEGVIDVEDNMKVYPNRSSAKPGIFFYLNEPSKVSVCLFSMHGMQVMTIAEGIFSSGEHQMPMAHETLAAGIYLVRFHSDYTTLTRTLIID